MRSSHCLIAPFHPLSQSEEKRSLALIHLRERLGKPAKLRPFLAARSPQGFRFLSSRRFRFFRWLRPLVEKFVQRDFERPGELFKRLDGGNGVTVFDSGDIAAQKTGAMFDVTLAEILGFSELSESLTYLHA